MNERILVVGDVLLDRYLHGSIKRVNPEAPGVVFSVERVEYRLGGAGAVAYLCAGLGCSVCLMGSVGSDDSGELVSEMAKEAGIRWHGWRGQKSTTVKERRVAGGRLLHDRTDYDCDCRESARPEWLNAAGYEKWDAIIVSDYGRGVVHERLVANLRKACPGMPIIVDPSRGRDWLEYEGATVIKCNRAERIEGMRPKGCTVVTTLDGDGIWIEGGKHVPTERKQVVDVTGCGDTVSAVLGWQLAQGADLEQACRMANKAAGIQVQRLGVQQIGLQELGEHDDAIWFAERARRDGKRVVFTNGCYDLFHAGHAATLQAAKELGDVLIVAINSDASVRRLKGESRPVCNQEQRAAVLKSLRCVDAVIVFDDDTPEELLRAIRPDVLAKGGTTNEIIGREIVESYGGKVVKLPPVEGLSSTSILHSLECAAAND